MWKSWKSTKIFLYFPPWLRKLLTNLGAFREPFKWMKEKFCFTMDNLPKKVWFSIITLFTMTTIFTLSSKSNLKKKFLRQLMLRTRIKLTHSLFNSLETIQKTLFKQSVMEMLFLWRDLLSFWWLMTHTQIIAKMFKHILLLIASFLQHLILTEIIWALFLTRGKVMSLATLTLWGR